MTWEHPPVERLSALIDGDLAADVAADVERHVVACAACRRTVAGLRALVDRAGALAPSIDPPPAMWRQVRSRLATKPAAVPPRADRIRAWALRAAAAILLVAGASTLTTLALRSRTPAGVAGAERRVSAADTRVPPALMAVDESYAGVVEELTATLQAQRRALAPETIATLERTLRVIDEAIAEARAALAADPANDALLDVLSANYEQKVQLLRRASELPART